jgi:predicted RNA-binding Zn-ribbon protein involved in translation (DUF1610 family)
MAIIKCPECGKDISDKAPICPQCGNPLIDREDDVITIQRTKKKHKKDMLIGLFVFITGAIMFLKGIVEGSAGLSGFGFFLGLVGFTSVLIARVRAWWTTG